MSTYDHLPPAARALALAAERLCASTQLDTDEDAPMSLDLSALASVRAALAAARVNKVEEAREKCILACRRAAEEEAKRGWIFTDRLSAIAANAVVCGKALLAAEDEAGKDAGK